MSHRNNILPHSRRNSEASLTAVSHSSIQISHNFRKRNRSSRNQNKTYVASNHRSHQPSNDSLAVPDIAANMKSEATNKLSDGILRPQQIDDVKAKKRSLGDKTEAKSFFSVFKPKRRRSSSTSGFSVPAPKCLSPASITAYKERVECKLAGDKLPTGIPNVDAMFKEYEDELHYSVYAQDITEYCLSKESGFFTMNFTSSPTQPIHAKMRATLFNWLTQVQNHEELKDCTLYLAMLYIDATMASTTIPTNQYQLYGITGLFIASKMEERYALEIKRLIYLTDNSYKYDEVIKCEQNMLKKLGFHTFVFNADFFLERFCLAAFIFDDSSQIKNFARYLYELVCIYEIGFLEPSSKLVAAAIYLSRMAVKNKPWNEALVYYSGYKHEDFETIIPFMAHIFLKNHLRTAEYSGARAKFSFSKFDGIAKNIALKNNTFVTEMAEKYSDNS